MNRAHMQSGPNAQAIQEGFVPHGGNNAALSTAPAYQPEAAPYPNNRYGNRQTDIYRTERYKYRTETDGNTKLHRLLMIHSASIQKTRMTGSFYERTRMRNIRIFRLSTG